MGAVPYQALPLLRFFACKYSRAKKVRKGEGSLGTRLYKPPPHFCPNASMHKGGGGGGGVIAGFYSLVREERVWGHCTPFLGLAHHHAIARAPIETYANNHMMADLQNQE